MSAQYSCSKCGATSSSGGNCCGRPKDTQNNVRVTAATTVRLSNSAKEARVQARRGKR